MIRLAVALALAASAGLAHVGSPDVFLEGSAGPYPLLVAIRPPAVIPGVAEIEIRARTGDVREVKITPLPMTGEASKFPPTPDVAVRSKDDPQFYTGSLWLMVTGSWQVRILVNGERGSGAMSVPVPAVAQRTQSMGAGLGSILAALMLLLAVGVVSIAGAAARESQLDPGRDGGADAARRGRRAMAVASLLVAGALVLGNLWWKAEAESYSYLIYKPLELAATLEDGNRLLLRLRDPGWLSMRKVDDLLPDHGHLMHLFIVRVPEMNRMWHLHPERREAGIFALDLPDMPAGSYKLFGDIVHENGFPETAVASIELPAVKGKPLAGDDSGAGLPAAGVASTGVAELSDGHRLVWERESGPLTVKKPAAFRFRMEDPQGRPATGMELYMGMQGHAAFVRHDLSVFAHVHPTGSVPMAALDLTRTVPTDPHAAHAMGSAVPATVSFPYGFPREGDYRIFVQVKRNGRVETGAFDVKVGS